MNWFACELHCHTDHSDGIFTPSELVKSAKEHQLDGIAITDHNTISPVLKVCAEGEKQGLVILKTVKSSSWYVAKIIGTIGGKESLIAITSPIFCE